MRYILVLCFVLMASLAQAATVTVSWTDNSANETGFTVSRKVAACNVAGEWFDLAKVAANVVTYVDSAVVAGSTYCYRVNAFNAAGASSWSDVAGITIPPPLVIPAAPSQVGVTVQP